MNGLTPDAKIFIAGVLIGAVYGVLFAVFQGAGDGRG
jgi:hypothetical protein